MKVKKFLLWTAAIAAVVTAIGFAGSMDYANELLKQQIFAERTVIDNPEHCRHPQIGVEKLTVQVTRITEQRQHISCRITRLGKQEREWLREILRGEQI